MGLTASSTGTHAREEMLTVLRPDEDTAVVALAGNPNVGKSTVFNALTGMHQHTGNWPGKTVASAQGICRHKGRTYALVDIPGAYSLTAHSAEEEVARDFLCFGGADAAVVVCDATCLERNMNLLLQVMELTPNVVACINLMDEAAKKQIHVDTAALERQLGIPVVGTSARGGRGLAKLMDRVGEVVKEAPREVHRAVYPDAIEAEAHKLAGMLEPSLQGRVDVRWAALRLLEGNESVLSALEARLGPIRTPELLAAAAESRSTLCLTGPQIESALIGAVYREAERVCASAVHIGDAQYGRRQLTLDRILTGRLTGIPIMLLLLSLVFYLTISGANVPSQMLADGLFWVQDRLTDAFHALNAPEWLHGLLVLGVYRVLAWVVSVMLPPMAIFFPLFTLLEDVGFLPRIAFNLDGCFKRCHACGKQALTVCMGFGCNAAGVIGCRIIDSPRERLIAILTNALVPCNGRFPTLIQLITMFFLGSGAFLGGSAASALMLTALIVLCLLVTFLASRLLSATVLKGVPSSFTLELPPFRRPQIGRVIVRSVFDRTLFVLGRAAAVAAPAGLLIWFLANVSVGGLSLMARLNGFLDPLGRLMGMDGVLLTSFILGFPANEIVLPLAIMGYLQTGVLAEMDSLDALRLLLVQNGWTWVTALCTMLFSLFHWPCSTTILTIHKETGSVKWTAIAFLLPTIIGMVLCMLVAGFARLAGLIS